MLVTEIIVIVTYMHGRSPKRSVYDIYRLQKAECRMQII